jgi:hypothetical protein
VNTPTRPYSSWLTRKQELGQARVAEARRSLFANGWFTIISIAPNGRPAAVPYGFLHAKFAASLVLPIPS